MEATISGLSKTIEIFLELFTPDNGFKPLTNESLGTYNHLLPDELIAFYTQIGIGSFANGHLFFVHPDELKNELDMWLVGKNKNAIPIARTAFGDIFYCQLFTPLTDSDSDLKQEYNISILDVHYKETHVCRWSLGDFLESYLCDNKILENTLLRTKFKESLQTLGVLSNDECYTFIPAIAYGGTTEGKTLKVKLKEHLRFLFQL